MGSDTITGWDGPCAVSNRHRGTASMQQNIIVGLAAGLASAALLALATMGGAGASARIDGLIIVYFLASLPAFLAGLGWGPVAAVSAAVAAGIGCTLLRGPYAGAMVLASQGVPVALVCYLAQLNRTVVEPASGHAAAPSETVEWYPVGRLIAVTALLAGAFGFLTVILLGTSIDDVRVLLRKLIENVFLKQLPGLKDRKVEEPEIQALTEVMLYGFPAAMALTWAGTFLLNFYIAGRVTQASGRLLRPWPDLATMQFPKGFGFALAISLAIATATQGYPALLAAGFAGAVMLAYLLMGLAILHHVSRGKPARALMLWGVYVGLVVLNPWSGLAVAMLGLVEPFLPWRRAMRKGPAPPV